MGKGMTPDEEASIVALMRENNRRSRGYADHWVWPTDRDGEERSVIESLVDSMAAVGESFYSGLAQRGRPDDPPDFEGRDAHGRKVAIELTEVVDKAALEAAVQAKRECAAFYDWAEWPREKFLAALAERITAKDKRHPDLKGQPYDGGYVVVLFTDEPDLPRSRVIEHLAGHRLPRPKNVSRAILLLSYDPEIGRYPHFELCLEG